MTPREKALNLVDQFMLSTNEYGMKNVVDYFAAIDCALIAVDEVLKQIKPYYILLDGTGFLGPNQNHVEYWQSIKQELEKL